MKPHAMSASSSPEVQACIARLFVYPIKSCAGLELSEAELTETGLDLDRAWMVVDGQGEFVSQRELPRMALVQAQLKWNEVILRAPGMLSLHLHVDRVEAPAKVRVWDDVVPAYDMGDTAAQWFSDFLGQTLRLARFDPDHRRWSDLQWTGGVQAPNQFNDGFPLLVVSEASLEALNTRLAAGGHAPVGIERFRPNIVLSGLQAHDEDRVGVMQVQADGGVQLLPVKPCPRCPIPDIDPATAQVGTAVGDTLQAYRRNDRLGGAVTFGMNAIVREGDGVVLRVGQTVTANWAF
jgi:uncharacterized protein YcbX